MRYIGGKSLLLDDLETAIGGVVPNVRSVIDVFAGSGVVSKRLADSGFDAICNDQAYFSYVILRGTVGISDEPKYERLGVGDPFERLNGLEPEAMDYENGFVYSNYSPHDGCERMYFTPENAVKIDAVRRTIEEWKKTGKVSEDEYFHLLASLVLAVPFVSNVAGVYAAYLKKWDPRALKPLRLERPEVGTPDGGKVEVFLGKGNDLLRRTSADVLYSDSPYNSREYLPNYHVLETIARGDRPEIRGVTGMRDYSSQKSDFCSKTKALSAFERMFRLADVRGVVVSYNNEGLVSTEDMTRLCERYAKKGTFSLTEIPYRRYKSRIPNETGGLMEQIYSFEKKSNPYDKSPMNYVGGKYASLPRLFRIFPDEIGTFVDLFCGGCDVSANAIAERVVANDVNAPVVRMYEAFRDAGFERTVEIVDGIVEERGLSKTNRKGFEELRKKYNESEERSPFELFALICFSFNHQIRFNSRLEYNNPFGANRSSFNASMRANLSKFCSNLKKISFSSVDFRDFDFSGLGERDFVYADPPYRITVGSYNDGKRGFTGWGEREDADLFRILDELDSRGVRFAMSNVFEHKGRVNERLVEWAGKYRVERIDVDYSNSSYHGKNRNARTDEVVVTNFRV